MSAVPVIDIGPLADEPSTTEPIPPSAAQEAAARAIDTACREVGFFTIVGHGVDPDLRARLDALARAFFARPEAEKAELAMARAGRAWRGWFPVGGELTSGRPDLKEGLYFGAELGPDDPRVRAGVPLHGANLFPEPADAWAEAVLATIGELTRVGQAVLRGMAIGLGLPAEWFAEHLTDDPLALFRIFHYPPAAVAPEVGIDEDAWGVGEHTDYGLLTILGQDRSGGLQVRTGGRWQDVVPTPDSYVCNIGDMLERLTGGRYRSTPHRVRNTSGLDRLSFPFFLDPSWTARVDPLPLDGVAAPADPRSDAAERWDGRSVFEASGTYGEYILDKVAQVFPQLTPADPPTGP